MAFIRNVPTQSNTIVDESFKKFQETKKQPKTSDTFNLQFTKDESIWMMGLIKDCTFKGIDVQKVYEAVVKLQLIINESK